MSVTYSTIKALSEPEAMAEFFAREVIKPVLPSVEVVRVRTREGRRFEAPRILWNVYEATLSLPGSVETRRLFWTKAYFDDSDCEDYRDRIDWMLEGRAGDPLDPQGYARFFNDLNLFLFVFPADPVFSELPAVMDPDSMRPILEPLFEHLYPGSPLRSLEAVRIKYLPEISGIVRYMADLGEGAQRSIYGKIQHSRRGAFTYEVMRALWDLPARESGELILAEPLGYYPDYDLLLQSELPGSEIDSDRHAPPFMAQAPVAGRALAHIHESGITLGREHSADIEFGRLFDRLEEFKMSSPQVYLALRDLLTQIRARERKLPPEERVSSHGDYKYNQFLHDGDRFGLIDVEYFVQAEPSFDLGKYCGHLVPSTPRHWSDTVQADKARRLFLDAYCDVRPEYEGARFPIYEALSLATRALVVTWAQSRNWEYTAETLIAVAYERLKTPWGA